MLVFFFGLSQLKEACVQYWYILRMIAVKSFSIVKTKQVNVFFSCNIPNIMVSDKFVTDYVATWKYVTIQ